MNFPPKTQNDWCYSGIILAIFGLVGLLVVYWPLSFISMPFILISFFLGLFVGRLDS